MWPKAWPTNLPTMTLFLYRLNFRHLLNSRNYVCPSRRFSSPVTPLWHVMMAAFVMSFLVSRRSVWCISTVKIIGLVFQVIQLNEYSFRIHAKILFLDPPCQVELTSDDPLCQQWGCNSLPINYALYIGIPASIAHCPTSQLVIRISGFMRIKITPWDTARGRKQPINNSLLRLKRLFRPPSLTF